MPGLIDRIRREDDPATTRKTGKFDLVHAREPAGFLQGCEVALRISKSGNLLVLHREEPEEQEQEKEKEKYGHMLNDG